MKKILIVSTVSRQFYLFEQGNIEVLKELGYEVHGAANFEDANERLDALDIIRHPFDIQRSPFNLKNIKAYFQLKKIMRDEQFDAVHCHSPMGGVLGRLAAKRSGIKKVLYTAHGFHFYKGSPWINWLIYYPIEKAMSSFTDVLITINNEDFDVAKKFHAKEIVQVPGIGIEIDNYKYSQEEQRIMKRELSLSDSSLILLSVGELNKNKNHEVVIEALRCLRNIDFTYLICGKGNERARLEKKILEYGLSGKVKLLGFRNDVDKIICISDLFIFPSYREGLSVSLLEAMNRGLPVICSDIRGNRDLIANAEGGYLFPPTSKKKLTNVIRELMLDEKSRERFGRMNMENSLHFSRTKINIIMKKIYE